MSGEEGAASGGAAPVDGRAVFTETCGSCHTLSAADTSGAVGPNLDDTSLGAADIIERQELAGPARPLAKERFAGGIDAVGSTTLAAERATPVPIHSRRATR